MKKMLNLLCYNTSYISFLGPHIILTLPVSIRKEEEEEEEELYCVKPDQVKKADTVHYHHLCFELLKRFLNLVLSHPSLFCVH